MKRLFVIAILFCGILSANAQEFKAFRVDLGLGYAIPKDGGGVILSFEPKYAVIPNVAVGLRMEAAGMAQVSYEMVNGQVQEVSGSVKLNGSYLLTGDYYFTNEKFRPYAGLGLGIYSLAGAEASSNTTIVNDSNVAEANNFGFMLRAGFDISHFRLSVEYNIAGKVKSDILGREYSSSYNYLGIKANVYIGGGVKK